MIRSAQREDAAGDGPVGRLDRSWLVHTCRHLPDRESCNVRCSVSNCRCTPFDGSELTVQRKFYSINMRGWEGPDNSIVTRPR